VIARLVRSADFERVLRTRSRASSAHFAVHHVADRPSAPAKPVKKVVCAELSTAVVAVGIDPVDDSIGTAPCAVLPEALWLGAVVPKRHAKRSVTRTLLKRQIRAAVGAQGALLATGLWVVRLRAPFDRSHFVSAASDELKRVARTELQQLLTSAVQRVGGR
jgi:ribonuclease P protein component